MKKIEYDYFLYVPRKWFLKKFIFLIVWKIIIALLLHTTFVMVSLLLDFFWWISVSKLAHEWRRYYLPVFFWSFAGIINILALLSYILIAGGN